MVHIKLNVAPHFTHGLFNQQRVILFSLAVFLLIQAVQQREMQNAPTVQKGLYSGQLFELKAMCFPMKNIYNIWYARQLYKSFCSSLGTSRELDGTSCDVLRTMCLLHSVPGASTRKKLGPLLACLPPSEPVPLTSFASP